MVQSGAFCCSKPYDLKKESLDQACGVLKEVKICLTPQATVGVIGGYLSLWFSIVQGAFTALLMLRERLTTETKGEEKEGEEKDTQHKIVTTEEGGIELTEVEEKQPNGCTQS